MIRYGVIELRVLQLLRNITIPYEFEGRWVKLPLGRKIDLVKSVAKNSDIPDPTRQRLTAVLARTRDLLKLRNVVAHNPLTAQIAFDAKGMKSELRIQVLNNPEYRFGFDDLSAALDEARRLDEDLLEVVTDDHLWRWSLDKAKQPGTP